MSKLDPQSRLSAPKFRKKKSILVNILMRIVKKQLCYLLSHSVWFSLILITNLFSITQGTLWLGKTTWKELTWFSFFFFCFAYNFKENHLAENSVSVITCAQTCCLCSWDAFEANKIWICWIRPASSYRGKYFPSKSSWFPWT